jgi:hypothetical protein
VLGMPLSRPRKSVTAQRPSFDQAQLRNAHIERRCLICGPAEQSHISSSARIQGHESRSAYDYAVHIGITRARNLAICINVSLMIIKIGVDVVGNSYALVADGIESASDIFSSVITWAGFRCRSGQRMKIILTDMERSMRSRAYFPAAVCSLPPHLLHIIRLSRSGLRIILRRGSRYRC